MSMIDSLMPLVFRRRRSAAYAEAGRKRRLENTLRLLGISRSTAKRLVADLGRGQ